MHPSRPPEDSHRLTDILRALAQGELDGLIDRLAIRIDPAKRIDVPSQVARALVSLPELRDPSRLHPACAELMHRVAEGRGLLVVPSVPPALEPLRGQVLAIVEQLEEFQRSAAAELAIDDEGVPFHVKKEVTSALRRLAPIGLSTDIVWSANLRTLRHVIQMRTAEGAEEELRGVFDELASVMVREAPLIFQDFERSPDGCWEPRYHKV